MSLAGDVYIAYEHDDHSLQCMVIYEAYQAFKQAMTSCNHSRLCHLNNSQWPLSLNSLDRRWRIQSAGLQWLCMSAVKALDV